MDPASDELDDRSSFRPGVAPPRLVTPQGFTIDRPAVCRSRLRRLFRTRCERG